MSIIDELSNIQVAQPKDLNEEQERIIESFFSDKKIFFLSELNKQEINYLVRLLVIYEKLKLPIIRQFINYFLSLRVSMDRKGRQEFLKATTLQPLQSGSDIPMIMQSYTGPEQVHEKERRLR